MEARSSPTKWSYFIEPAKYLWIKLVRPEKRDSDITPCPHLTFTSQHQKRIKNDDIVIISDCFEWQLNYVQYTIPSKQVKQGICWLVYLMFPIMNTRWRNELVKRFTAFASIFGYSSRSASSLKFGLTNCLHISNNLCSNRSMIRELWVYCHVIELP